MLQMYRLLFRNKAMAYGVFHKDIVNRCFRMGTDFCVIFSGTSASPENQPVTDVQKHSYNYDA
jgi:hypothetical protein